MSARKNVSVLLSSELHTVVERMLDTGRYRNFGEVVAEVQNHSSTSAPAAADPVA